MIKSLSVTVPSWTFRRGGNGAWKGGPVWAAPVALLVLLIAFRPTGYLGGGGDEFYYLEAARCVAQHGLCLPETHWQARLSVVAPIGWVMGWQGDSPLSVAIVPFAYIIAATILFALNVKRCFGRTAAMLASFVLVLTTAFSLYPLEPGVDVPELAWVLAALLAGQISVEHDDRRLAALAGVALALALMSRLTALSFLPIIALGWFLLPASKRWLAIPFGLGFAAILGAEAAAYYYVTGNPAYSWLLSLHHTRIPSTELPPGIDLSRGALFNLDLIRNWKRSMGIEVHWTVDPLLNLVADPHCGLTLIGAGGLALTQWRGAQMKRPIIILAIAALLHFLILTFVLAIDPKPRMFLFEFAVAATVIGVLGVQAWRVRQRALLTILLLLIALRCLAMTADSIDLRPLETAANDWVAAVPNGLHTDEWSRRTLALVPAANVLPIADTTYRGPLLRVVTTSCEAAAQSAGADWRVVRAQAFMRAEPSFVTAFRNRGIIVGPRETSVMCLLAPTGGPAGASRSG